MKGLHRILWKDHSRTHLLWAFLGTLAGFILLLSGLQFYLEFRKVLQDNRDLLDPEFIIINKKVNLGQSLGITPNGFSDKEVEDLAAQEFAEKVDAFISNQFPIQAYTQSERIPNFYTELFFEAIPDEYVDVKTEDWTWDPEEGSIPVIIPQDFLNLYNFGFAQSQGLPQVPKGVISMVNFKIRLRGDFGRYEDHPGRIVGFSNRIHSILVPYDFLQWANERFGYFEQNKPSRLIMVTKDPTDPNIMKYLEGKGFDTIRERLKGSRLNVVLKLVLSFLVLIAALIIGLAFLVFLLSLQLMISRSATKIQRLNKLGFHQGEIALPYLVLLSILLLTVSLMALFLSSLIAQQMAAYAGEWSLELSASLHSHIFLSTGGLVVLIFLANAWAISRSTRKLCT